MNKTFEEIDRYREKAVAINAAIILFEWDDETLAPAEGGICTARIVGSLAEQYKGIMTDESFKKLVFSCEQENLSETELGIVEAIREEIEQLSCIPDAEYRAHKELISKSSRIWAGARKKADFRCFAPVLQNIVDYEKRFASYRAREGQKLYDVLLDTYEKDFNMEMLDRFFEKLKKGIIPILKERFEHQKQIDTSFLNAAYSIEAQEEAARYLARYLGFNFSRGVLAVSAHPFTTNLHNRDVRITTNYGARIDSSMFSVLHETGHALYELGIRDELTLTPAGRGASMGMHEAQSRFFENAVGRNKAFWEPIYGDIQDIFGEPLKSTSLDSFIEAVNQTKPGPIRIEADELSYALHILIRFEIEKMIIEENVPVTDLPKIWNQKYEEYLGVKPENDREGILQDIHWSQGSLGYFPSYALGSAFAAQIYYHMRKVMDFEGLLREGKISEIVGYLRENIHQYGKLKTSRQLIKDVTGEEFNPEYYVKYLEEKYGN